MRFQGSVIVRFYLSISNAFLLSSPTCAWSLSGQTVDDAGPWNLSNQIATSDGDIHEKARAYVVKLRNAPTCTRLAARDLASKCQTSSGANSSEAEHFRSLYATRLAICELEDAGVARPAECDLRDIQQGHVSFLRFRRDPKAILNKCLNALVSRPQSWTSYSNNLQNVFILCQAARSETERENVIELFNDLASNNKRSHDALRQWHAFAGSQLVQMDSWARRLDELAGSLHARFQSESSQVADALKAFQSEVFWLKDRATQVVTDLAQHALEETSELDSAISIIRSRLNAMLFLIQKGNEDVNTQQRQETEKNLALTVNVSDALNTLLIMHTSVEQRLVRLDRQIQTLHLRHEHDSAAIYQKSQDSLQALISIAETARSVNQLLPGSLIDTFVAWKNRVLPLSLFIFVLGLLPRAGFLPATALVGVLALTMFSCHITSQHQYVMDRLLPLANIMAKLILITGITLSLVLVVRVGQSCAASRSKPNPSEPKPRGSAYLADENAVFIFQYYDPSSDQFVDSVPNSSGPA